MSSHTFSDSPVAGELGLDGIGPRDPLPEVVYQNSPRNRDGLYDVILEEWLETYKNTKNSLKGDCTTKIVAAMKAKGILFYKKRSKETQFKLEPMETHDIKSKVKRDMRTKLREKEQAAKSRVATNHELEGSTKESEREDGFAEKRSLFGGHDPAAAPRAAQPLCNSRHTEQGRFHSYQLNETLAGPLVEDQTKVPCEHFDIGQPYRLFEHGERSYKEEDESIKDDYDPFGDVAWDFGSIGGAEPPLGCASPIPRIDELASAQVKETLLDFTSELDKTPHLKVSREARLQLQHRISECRQGLHMSRNSYLARPVLESKRSISWDGHHGTTAPKRIKLTPRLSQPPPPMPPYKWSVST